MDLGNEEIAFNEEVSGKLGELHKQKTLQANLAHQISSFQVPGQTGAEEEEQLEEQVEVHVITAEIVWHQGDKTEDIP